MHSRGGAGLAQLARASRESPASSDGSATHRAGATGRALAEPVARLLHRDAGDGQRSPSPLEASRPTASPRCGFIRLAGAPSTTRRPSRLGSTPAVSPSRWRADSYPKPRPRRIDGVLVAHRAARRRHRPPGVHAPGRSRHRDVARGVAAGGGPRPRRRRSAQPDALRASRPVREGPRPRSSTRPARRRRCDDTALAYTAEACCVSFAAVAGALLALRAGGEQHRLGLPAPVAARS